MILEHPCTGGFQKNLGAKILGFQKSQGSMSLNLVLIFNSVSWNMWPNT